MYPKDTKLEQMIHNSRKLFDLCESGSKKQVYATLLPPLHNSITIRCFSESHLDTLEQLYPCLYKIYIYECYIFMYTDSFLSIDDDC